MGMGMHSWKLYASHVFLKSKSHALLVLNRLMGGLSWLNGNLKLIYFPRQDAIYSQFDPVGSGLWYRERREVWPMGIWGLLRNTKKNRHFVHFFVVQGLWSDGSSMLTSHPYVLSVLAEPLEMLSFFYTWTLHAYHQFCGGTRVAEVLMLVSHCLKLNILWTAG